MFSRSSQSTAQAPSKSFQSVARVGAGASLPPTKATARLTSDRPTTEKDTEKTAGSTAAEPPATTAISSSPPVNMPRSASGQRSLRANSRTAPGGDGVSIIGRDLAIIGSGLRIVSRGTLQIEGEVRGDVYGDEIVIGDEGKVSGLVVASRVNVHGTVMGTVKAQAVVLHGTSHVEGEIHHAALSLEQGAMFEGRSRRPADPETLVPDLDAAANEDASAPHANAPRHPILAAE